MHPPSSFTPRLTGIFTIALLSAAAFAQTAGLQMRPDGSRAFVASGPHNYLAVFNLQSLEVTSHIDAGGEPDGMAWAVCR